MSNNGEVFAEIDEPTPVAQRRDEATATTKGANTRDPELVALTRIFGLLDALNVDARSRVVRYIAEKYEGLLDADV